MQEVFSCDCLDHLNTFWDKWYWVNLQRLYSQLKLKGFVVMFFFNPLSPNGRFQEISIPYHSFHILTPLSFEISKMHYPHFPFFLSDPLELLAGFANRSNLAYVTPKYFKWLYFCTSVQLLTEWWEQWPLTNIHRRHMWVEFVVGCLLYSERFFSGYSSFPLSSKTNICKFQFHQGSGRRRTTRWMCYL